MICPHTKEAVDTCRCGWCIGLRYGGAPREGKSEFLRRLRQQMRERYPALFHEESEG